MKKILAALLFCTTALPIVAQAQAQTWPSKPIKLIVPFPPGGPVDYIARQAANILRDEFKQPVVVDNRPGGNGVTGHDVLAKSAPDGYTIGMELITVSIAPHLGEIPFDPAKDLAPITNFAAMTPVLLANKDTPFNSLADLVKSAKENPRKYAFGTPGVATIPHLAAELLKTQAGISLLHVPYKGATQQVQDLIGGTTQLDFQSSLTVALPQLKAGRVKALVVFTPKRSPQLPDVPTVIEAGYPELVVQPWFGIGAPAGVPDAIIQKLHAALTKGLRSPEVIEHLTKIGATAQPSASPAEFASFIKNESVRWGKVIKDNNIKAQ
ncbi:Bug family tripartite tricarboxylate transporter substrate binding protein [Lacisediminimonas profundi]|uniref:Bug family tripartite tricarboxylate transporter substrate binding protein n=1 Tax=Lacisediminimonas profundi TaxID=2603856 RepID=UPI00124B825D|nr:tripartite tricarboxylate transporter substrate binding protein [Lacisediminimonas profundi]